MSDFAYCVLRFSDFLVLCVLLTKSVTHVYMSCISGAHTAVPGGVDLVQPCDLKSPAVDATPTLPSPRKSLAVPDNLRELIYSKPIQLPVCTRVSGAAMCTCTIIRLAVCGWVC